MAWLRPFPWAQVGLCSLHTSAPWAGGRPPSRGAQGQSCAQAHSPSAQLVTDPPGVSCAHSEPRAEAATW